MKNDDIQKWITAENGTHIPIRRGQTKSEAVNAFFNQDDDYKYPQYLARMNGNEGRPKEEQQKKMTPAEKIASVHIDFDRDNVLPELNEEDLQKIGIDGNKSVLIKKSIIDRNMFYHKDAMMDTDKIIGETLYNPSEIFPGKSDKDYFTFIKPLRLSIRNGKDEYGVVLLDVTESNKNFEVVHWHWINYDNLSSLRAKKKD